MKMLLNLPVFLLLLSCHPKSRDIPVLPAPDAVKARVLAVAVSGAEGGYTFSVEVKSPDTGCGQYADWWEVLDREGNLKYRRILLHSHVDEQPFTRSGGPVPVGGEEFVYVRAHMNTSGYGTEVFSGTVAGGFTADTLDAGFAEALAGQEPLPEDCDF